ncbi:MAG: FtsW/RodA/SpoVE family cell cycle protein [Ilumatobacteraceae bacterium]
MSSSSTLIGDRRRAALERKRAVNRHPSQRAGVKPAAPPPVAFYVIAVVTTIFTMLGLVMVLSATAIAEFHKGNSPWRLFNRQALWASFGVIGLWAAMRVPMRTWRRLVTPAFVVACGLMVLPFVPGVGTSINDARSWVAIGPLSFQPSEFLKLALLLACAELLASRRHEMHLPGRTMGPVFVMSAVAVGLCLLQGDLGSAIVLAAIVFAVLFIAGAPLLPSPPRAPSPVSARSVSCSPARAARPASPRSWTSPPTRIT